MKGNGFLAIWSDVDRDKETDYLHWLTREHTGERVGIDGFLGVRVFRELASDVNRFFIVYDLAEPEVVGSQAYLARLDSPTPWSQRIMPLLGNFIRGGGRIVATAGTGEGGFVVPLRVNDDLARKAAELVETVASEDRIAAVRFLQTDRDQTSIQTREKALRAADASFAGLLLIEALDERAARHAGGRVASGGMTMAPSVYGQFFSLRR